MESEKRSKLVITSQLLLMLAMVAWLIMSLQSKRSLNKALDREKLHSEALLSEKLLTEKALHKTKLRNVALESDNTILRRSRDEKNQLATRRKASNDGLRKVVDRYRKELEDKHDTIGRLKTTLKKVCEHHAFERVRWETTTDSLQHIRKEMQYVKDERDAAIRQTIDQPLITALKKNVNRITTKSAATWKLVAQVEVPATLNDMSFIVEGPEGNNLTGSVSSRILDDGNKRLTASVKKMVPADVYSKTVEISYQPGEKLKPGVYALKIFNDNRYVGRIKIKLN